MYVGMYVGRYLGMWYVCMCVCKLHAPEHSTFGKFRPSAQMSSILFGDTMVPNIE